ncbi:hypothetical protein [Prauserella endophytica]|uniref:SWIM-type domain-containing protein n=1 Tax=Prauserella endophytica TaxID=1592324 RepID=A0ABY2RV23_9PSEU|nr:hypothetical protein [Prauserella endophytica]TKG61545.1 hypothetical protein FCN18_33440 [Prauserella endophytica]
MKSTKRESDEHFLEESVQVYLRFSDGRWVLDRPTLDGAPLDSVLTGGASNSECECGDPAGCERARAVADQAPLPNAEDLYALLLEALA